MSVILKKQKQVSHVHPLPVDITDESSRVTDVSGEAVSFIVASTNVADAGSAAGTVVYARLTNSGILDSAKLRIGSENDTSFSWGTGTVLTTLVEFDWETWESNQYQTRATKMAAIGANLSNGQYAIDHRSRLIIGKKATTGTSDTASYSYSASVSSADEVVFVDDTDTFTPGTSKALVIGGFVDDTGTDSADEGDKVAWRFSARRAGMVSMDTLLYGENQTDGYIATQMKPTSTSTDKGTRFQSNSFTTTNLKASAGTLLYINVHNTTGSNRYLQGHNTATTPAGGATALDKFLIGPGANHILGPNELGHNGLNYTTGLALAASTVLSTFTAATAGDLTVDAIFI